MTTKWDRPRLMSPWPRAHGLGVVIGLCAAWSSAAGVLAAEATLSAAIERLVSSAGAMKIGVRIEQLSPAPAVVFEHNGDVPFKPASNQKILTSAAALSMLSPDFTYRTILAVRGDDLVIIGAGDPSCGDPRMAQAAREPVTAMFRAWGERLLAAGIDHLDGDLLFDDSVFDDEVIRQSWVKQFNLQEWYCAPVGGLNFNDNCIDVVVRPGKGGVGTPAEVLLLPATSWVTLKNTAKTAKEGEPIFRRLGDGPITIWVSGSVSKPNSPTEPRSIAITDPGMFFASVCRSALAGQGIRIAGQTRRTRVRGQDGKLPADLRVIAVHERKIADVLWRVDKSSINMFAEAVVKTLGAYAGREDAPAVGSYENGRAVLTRFLDRLGVPPADYVIDDGSGLSHDNRVTPAMMTAILKYMNAHPRRKEWWANLAVPGEQVGTLRRRMKDLAGQVFAKTGTIKGVSTLSGYVVGAEGRVYAFSVLCNETERAKVSPHTLQDSICRQLASWGAPSAATSKTQKGG
ncbi:MAG: D-alanyl-D-alanine carboxypeptidase/D-alanyl-D-alanine-endopeptidase [Phycisphaerae bacterium]